MEKRSLKVPDMISPDTVHAGTALRNATLLLIDDDPDVVWTTTRMLEGAGCRVVSGSNGAQGIELARRHRPALVLLDVVLPDVDGLELARRMKLDPALAGVFVVLVSGTRVTPEQQAEGLERGLADGYILRPFGKVDFLARIESFLRIRSVQEALRKEQETSREYARRLVVLEEELRKKISADLHDDIGQGLAALAFQLGSIAHCLPQDLTGEARERLEEAQDLTRGMGRSVRQMMGELRPTLLDDFGLAEALRTHAAEFARRTGRQVTFQVDPEFPQLPPQTNLALFRIVQEALLNVAKHAEARTIRVVMSREGAMLRLCISDDGKGFEPPSPGAQQPGSGWGLSIMRERAALVGGRLRIDTAPGAGTSVDVEIGDAPAR